MGAVVTAATSPASAAASSLSGETGFGAELKIVSATLFTPQSVDTLVLTFMYESPDRLSTRPGIYFLNMSVNGELLSLTGTVGKVFDRGISDVVTVSAPLTPAQSLHSVWRKEAYATLLEGVAGGGGGGEAELGLAEAKKGTLVRPPPPLRSLAHQSRGRATDGQH